MPQSKQSIVLTYLNPPQFSHSCSHSITNFILWNFLQTGWLHGYANELSLIRDWTRVFCLHSRSSHNYTTDHISWNEHRIIRLSLPSSQQWLNSKCCATNVTYPGSISVLPEDILCKWCFLYSLVWKGSYVMKTGVKYNLFRSIQGRGNIKYNSSADLK